MSRLVLPIKKKWFEMIRNGEKEEEYREIKPYYEARFKTLWGSQMDGKTEREIVLRNGYSKTSREISCDCTLRIGFGKPEWGAEKGKLYYVLGICGVKETRR